MEKDGPSGHPGAQGRGHEGTGLLVPKFSILWRGRRGQQPKSPASNTWEEKYPLIQNLKTVPETSPPPDLPSHSQLVLFRSHQQAGQLTDQQLCPDSSESRANMRAWLAQLPARVQITCFCMRPWLLLSPSEEGGEAEQGGSVVSHLTVHPLPFHTYTTAAPPQLQANLGPRCYSFN